MAETMGTINVLLLDDEQEFSARQQRRLTGRGLVTFVVANGLEALRLLDEHAVDVVVLDVKMPSINGLEVLRKTKQKHPLVEVILLPGYATVQSAVDGLKLGAFDYVTKPCDFSELVEKTNAAYARKETTVEKIRKAAVEKIIRRPMAVFEREER
jgi:DNA-binding NtrC family response regulator